MCIESAIYFFWQIHLNLHEFIYIHIDNLSMYNYVHLFIFHVPSFSSKFFFLNLHAYIYNTYPSYISLYICNMYSNLIPKPTESPEFQVPKCTSFPATAGFGLALAMGRDGWPGLRKCMDLRRALKVGLEDRCGRYAPPCGFSFSIMEESHLINLDVFVACFLISIWKYIVVFWWDT